MCCRRDSGVKDDEDEEFVEPCLKYMLTLFNFIFLSVGAAYIIIGSYLLYERDRLLSETGFEGVSETTRDLGIAFICLGIPTIAFTLFGIVATLREHLTILKVYMAFLIVFLILGVMIGVIFFIFSGKIQAYVVSKLKQQYLVNYFDDPDSKAILDTLQIKFSCCGVDSYQDWSKNVYFNCNTTKSAYRCMVPYSCCTGATMDTNTFCSGDILSPVPTQMGSVNVQGCSKALTQLQQYVLYIVAGIMIGTTFILLAGVILVRLLIKEVEEDIKSHNAKFNLERDMANLSKDEY